MTEPGQIERVLRLVPKPQEPLMENAKNILKSKTFWFNIAAGLWNLAAIQGFITVLPEPWPAMVQSVGNIALRYVTTQPVTLGTPPTQS